ncbi:hypothetical protein [Pseudosulfitobacter sp. DSM 107133]|uniref:hypothetical protein n=1 Tax=Pseudosulfitobacter sp. DSM 107133 TaxID=2883100 RepID=UPI0013B3D7C0|nr:hypothetical protein [Pseudosulfitobacter sp. DSM 107133]UOA28667.1 hypothetical protein DSM107133_03417 [Pseudosulfitobacter sp. DSM 107133]
MKFDGYDRDSGKLAKYIDGTCIAPRLVEIRADFARSEALRHFFDAKEASDFYFEDLLNSFVALALYPVNFAVFVEDGDRLVQKCHFCLDQKHEDNFNADLEKLDKTIGDPRDTPFFRLFPDLLEGPRHFIVIYHMDTKKSVSTLVRSGSSCFPLTRQDEQDQRFDPSLPVIQTADQYIASCADYFFQFKWDVFTSNFAEQAGLYLARSLERLSADHQDWNVRAQQVAEFLDSTSFPDLSPDGTPEDDPRPNHEWWKNRLNGTFRTVLHDTRGGISLVTSMMQEKSAPQQKEDPGSYPPNMFLAFRTFSRDVDKARHRFNAEKQGYLYDTSFLVPDDLRRNFSLILGKIRHDGENARAKVDAGDAVSFADAYEGPNATRRLYRNITLGDDADTRTAKTLRILDDDFWNLISEDKGVDQCIRILESWVGSKVRSLVDPVYHTGLIHTNHLFELGGLDRLGQLGAMDIGAMSDVPENCWDDVRRVTIFYYVLSEMMGWAGTNKAFEPSNLAAVLIPIRMRGSVWGVTIHGVYTPDYETIFADQRYWQGCFKLMTDHRQKNSQLFDRYLWGLAEQLVVDLFLRFFPPQLRYGAGDFKAAIDDINNELLCAMRYSPFAFPKFEEAKEQPTHENHVSFSPHNTTRHWLMWEIVDNPFFTARQSWDKRATRNFVQVVAYAILSSMDKRASEKTSLVR